MDERLLRGFDLHGAKFRIVLDDPERAGVLDAAVPLGCLPVDPGEAGFSLSLVSRGDPAVRGLYFDGYDRDPILRFDELDSGTLKGIETKILFAIALGACPRLFLLHAGAVAFGGHGLLIVGGTHSGKTSLVRELLRCGADYFTDDCAVLSSDGTLYPNPQPLGIRGAGDREFVGPEAFGADAGSSPVRVGTVVFTGFREGARWEPERIGIGPASMLLLKNFFYPGAVNEYPAESMRFAAAVFRNASAFRGERGEAREVADWLRRRVEQE